MEELKNQQGFEDIDSGQTEKLSDTADFDDDFDPSELDISKHVSYQPISQQMNTQQYMPPPIQQGADNAAAKQINGISYRKMRKSSLSFNNSEPSGMAFRSIALQLLAIAVVAVLVFAFLAAKSYVVDKLTDDSIFTLTMSSKYGQTASVKGISDFTAGKSYGYSAIVAISDFAGTPITEAALSKTGKDNTALISGMTSALEKALPSCFIMARQNLTNYTLLTEIHDNLSEGNGVIVPMAISEDKYAVQAKNIVYCIVTSANYSTDKITVVTPFGRTDTMSAEDFISATRYSAYSAKSPTITAEFALGLKAKNTAFFIERKTNSVKSKE